MPKSLIAITTTKRLDEVLSFSPDYVTFCNNNPEFDFLIALDGPGKDYQDFAENYNLPLLFSEKNEGVGLSKNRVLKSFPDYDYYFFIEDDVELLNPEYFNEQISISEETGIPHFSVYPAERTLEVVTTSLTKSGDKIIHAMYGSAQVNFFTKSGLEKVGGFHTEFAKYCRFGHTEHSTRYYLQGLAKAPFNVVEKFLEGYFRWHLPKSIVSYDKYPSDKKIGLAIAEIELMKEKIKHFPLQTLCKYEHNHNSLSLNIKNWEYKLANPGEKDYLYVYRNNPFMTDKEKIRLLSDRGNEYIKHLEQKSYQYYSQWEAISLSISYRVARKLLSPLNWIKK